jgi:hypothetical protein
MAAKCHPNNSGENNISQETLTASADEALLDEFFSLLAGIALRLTTKDAKTNNELDSSSEGVCKS